MLRSPPSLSSVTTEIPRLLYGLDPTSLVVALETP